MTLILLAIAALAALRIYTLDLPQRRSAPQPKPSPTPSPVRVGTRTVNAHEYPGDDIGTKINNAAKALHGESGQIILTSGGLFKATATIPSGCILLLKGGLYRSVTPGALVLLSDNAALVGDNWDAVLEESTGESISPGISPVTGRPVHTIVQDLAGANLNGTASRGIRIEHVHFRGARKDFNSAFQTASLGNCNGGRAVRNFFELTRTIALQVGGGSQLGNYARDCVMDENRFVGVASQNIAVTNGVNISVRRNTCERAGQPGGPGSTCIDIEPNVGDRVEDVVVEGNVIDSRQTPQDASGGKVLNAIAINNGNGAKPWRNIRIIENEILGWEWKPGHVMGGGISYAAILVRSSVGAYVERNKVTRCARGILIDTDSRDNHIEENQLFSCGSGSTAAIEIQDTSRGNVVRGNRLSALPGDGFEEVSGRIWSAPGNLIGDNPGASKR
ncbi:MAG TPA: right-handed parallel beta-helix repeat-containing protein [Pyrinomonadaceae bacterium]|nr:right-handed parallel beta-helix repeat-containing protein [Pyrinomonadaceae bacterium]